MSETSRSPFSCVAPPAALLLAVAVFSSSMNFTVIAQQEGPKKRTEEPGAEKRSSDRKIAVKVNRDGAVAITRRGYYDK